MQVISSEGLTKKRLEILQKLLSELSTCDEEAKVAVEALQTILSELQPQGKNIDMDITQQYGTIIVTDKIFSLHSKFSVQLSAAKVPDFWN